MAQRLGIAARAARRSQRTQIKQRFLDINRERLLRAREVLNSRQQLFLDALPLLFHVNHPILPGYVSQQVPCGVAHYQPDDMTLRRVQRQLAGSFVYRPPLQRSAQIHSLFLMGSCGTIAQSDRSDLDIWLCPAPDLDASERDLLLQKAELVSTWGASLGLDAHFFLMDSNEFRRGEREALTVEDCGSSQHFLLLDEFYRTSLLLAGRLPLWWLIPPEQEARYDDAASKLQRRLDFNAEDCIDFGGISQIPAGEFIGAGIWQLYKAIYSPHKSVLKLLLTEVYANEYPGGEPLALTFKRQVYAGQLDIDRLDPYIAAFERLERYLLERGESDRLELVRRCFYFKVGLKLSQRRATTDNWRLSLMRELVQRWGWAPEHLVNLDTREQWRVRRAKEEHSLLVRELTDSYRFLQDFARRSRSQALINSQEMTILGRKLYAAFERKPGKMEWLNPGIAPSLSEEDLSFHYWGETDGKPQWAVHAEHPHPAGFDPRAALKKGDSLLALLAWCYCNGLMTASTRLHISGQSAPVSEAELLRITHCLREQLPAHSFAKLQEEHGNFSQPKHPTQIMVFANVGSGANKAARNRDVPVHNTEVLLLNSWGEVIAQRFAGDTAIVEGIRQFLQMAPPGLSEAPPPSLHFFCFAERDAKLATDYLEQLARNILRCYYSGRHPLSSRYVIEVGGRFYILQPQEHDIEALAANSYSELIQLLGKSQPEYSPIVLDAHCAQNSALAAILKRARTQGIQVFLHSRDDFVDVFVMDEKASLFYSPMLCRELDALHHALNAFLTAGQPTTPAAPRLDYYRLQQEEGQWQTHKLSPPRSAGRYHAVQAIAHTDSSGHTRFDLAFNNQRYSHAEWGERLYKELARQVADAQREPAPYHPCYVTELQWHSGNGKRHQTVQRLHYKQLLEEAINTELLSIDPGELSGTGGGSQ